MTKSTCKQKLSYIVPSACIIIAGIFIILSTTTLPAVLKSSIADELKMGPDTYEYWGQSPGMTKSVTRRNFTFFNFTNPRQFLYQNKTPVFNQIHGYMLQQRFNYTEYNYTQNMDEVYYYDWMFFTEIQGSRSLEQKVNVINFAPLGFWYQIDKVEMPTFALQGFGGLFVQLNETFKTQAIGQGVNSQFLPNYTNWRSFCLDNQIPMLQCNFTWFDPQHGLSDQNNYELWVLFAYHNDYQAQMYLQEYFGFNDFQMLALKSTFYQWSDTVNEILENWFCGGDSCSSNYLTLLQLSSGNVTADPPSGDAVDSICDTGNVTCIGQPEISKFLKNEFKKKFDDQKYQKLKFSIQTFRQLFSPYNGTLLNIGNLTKLFQTGYKHDKSESISERNSLLQSIQQQTHSESVNHAFVIWEWVKYFTSEFVLKLGKGGSEKNSGIGGVFSQAFYQAFSSFGDWILDEYLDLLGLQKIQNCEPFVKQIIEGISQEKVTKICSGLNEKGIGYSKLFKQCFSPVQLKEQYRTNTTLSISQLAEYCDTQQQSFYTVALQIHERLFNQFNCSGSKGLKICSRYQLSLKQFINSTITLNPITNNIKTYPKSLSAKSWKSDFEQFEYRNFLKQAYGNENIDNQTIIINEADLTDLLSFDKLFSASMVMELMLQKDDNKFKEMYHWNNMTYLKNFVKFITVQIGFGGFTQKRTPRQLLFGYEDPFLKALQQTDPMMGGDPSIQAIVMLNEPNITEQQARLFPQSVYTGYSDIALTRQYSTLYNFSYLTYNKTYYDGYQIQSQLISPYKKNIQVKGTDAIQHPPGLDEKSSIYCLIANIYRTAQLDYAQHTELYDVDLLEFRVSKYFLASEEQYPFNTNYWQKFEGFHNVTFLGVPLHISKNNFLSCPQNWSDLVVTYDEKGQNQITASMVDDTVLKVQPNTGALFFATVRLQTNYHFQSDELFGPGDRMLPITNVIRQGQVEEETVNQLFGDLKMALKFQKVLLILATIIVPLSTLALAYRCYIDSQKRKQTEQIEKSLIQRSQEGSLVTQNTSGSIVQTNSESNLKLEQSDSVSDSSINTPIKILHNAQKQQMGRQQPESIQKMPNQRIQEINTIVIQEPQQKPESGSLVGNINQTIAQ